ncbi:hypothetical protein [Albibacterium sp.]|uniref:hypothetical protein n=1 Tax=Albibacterium sp. TaxID=2952885 RepID=UPI002C36BB5D|nr:hypothetical protein [Albibacterium sp.]HUH18102.1 hypothetical protein [Albibacterium sp.]
MKKKLQKISIVVAAIVLFVGAMLLSVKKNDHGQWKVATVSSFAQGGGESGGGEDGGEEDGVKSIIISDTGTTTECIANKVHNVISFTVICLGDGNLQCVSGDFNRYESTEFRCGIT